MVKVASASSAGAAAGFAPSGRVRNARIRSSVPMLDQASIDAVRQWVFEPPVRNGAAHPIDIRVTVVYPISR